MPGSNTSRFIFLRFFVSPGNVCEKVVQNNPYTFFYKVHIFISNLIFDPPSLRFLKIIATWSATLEARIENSDSNTYSDMGGIQSIYRLDTRMYALAMTGVFH